MAAGAVDVEDLVGLTIGMLECVGVLDALVLAAPLKYEAYEEDCADAKLQPKKLKKLCSVKSEATSEGSSTGVVVDAT